MRVLYMLITPLLIGCEDSTKNIIYIRDVSIEVRNVIANRGTQLINDSIIVYSHYWEIQDSSDLFNESNSIYERIKIGDKIRINRSIDTIYLASKIRKDTFVNYSIKKPTMIYDCKESIKLGKGGLSLKPNRTIINDSIVFGAKLEIPNSFQYLIFDSLINNSKHLTILKGSDYLKIERKCVDDFLEDNHFLFDILVHDKR